MARRGWVWAPGTRPGKPSEAEKQEIVTACETFIRDILRPRFLPVIKPTAFNYPIELRGDWRGGRYRFLERYRSGFSDNRGEEFDAPFARLDYRGRDKFDLYWHRHTGEWICLHRGISLIEALRLIETDPWYHPH